MTWTQEYINDIIKMLAAEIAMTRIVYSKKVEAGKITQLQMNERIEMLGKLIEEKKEQLMELEQNPFGLAKVASELVEFRVTYAPKIAAAAMKINANNIANMRFGYVGGTLNYITGLESVCAYSTKDKVQLTVFPQLGKVVLDDGIWFYSRIQASAMMSKVANWKMTFKRILNSDYGSPTPAELKLMKDTYSANQFDIEMIEYYLKCQTYPFKAGEAKTIKTFLSQYHILEQMYKQKDIKQPIVTKMPNVWDGTWYQKQDIAVQQEYVAHLKLLGFTKQISSGGVTFYARS